MLKKQAGPRITQNNINEYMLGDISSTIYPVNGGMEDWAYGGGWDYDNEATLVQCTPKTYLLEGIDLSKEKQQNVRCAIYIVETYYSKKPEEHTLGKRSIVSN